MVEYRCTASASIATDVIFGERQSPASQLLSGLPLFIVVRHIPCAISRHLYTAVDERTQLASYKITFTYSRDVNRLVSVVFGWLPFPGNSAEPRQTNQMSVLGQHAAVEKIAAKESVEEVFTVENIFDKNCILLPGHLLRSLVKTGLLPDVVSLFDKEANVHFLVIQTGAEVCGHTSIVHGGLQGMLCDEVFAGLIYGLKRQGALAEGPAVTANLSVNFRKPMPAQIPVLCTAKVQKMEGRKVFVEASIGDLEGGAHYADATALFILMQLQNKAVPDHPS